MFNHEKDNNFYNRENRKTSEAVILILQSTKNKINGSVDQPGICQRFDWVKIETRCWSPIMNSKLCATKVFLALKKTKVEAVMSKMLQI